MPRILYDTIHIKNPQELISEHASVIDRIIHGALRYPNVRKLNSVTYHGEDVYRARTNKSDRLIYTYAMHQGERTLMLLSFLDTHNYNQVRAQLEGLNPQAGVIDLKDTVEEQSAPLEELDAPAAVLAQQYKLIPTHPFKKQHLLFDEQQEVAMSLSTPLILSGPPGSGKTAVLYSMLLKNLELLNKQAQMTAAPAEVLFISQSEPLIQGLAQDFIRDASQVASVPVRFTTWIQLLQPHYPDQTPVSTAAFGEWLEQSPFEGRPKQVHYELSIIAALSPKEYLKLGKRQSYFAGQPEKQKELIGLAEQWNKYLAEHQLFDPMTAVIVPTADTPRFLTVYCDETQNLPPSALLYLMSQAQQKQFIACLDSEQCLLSSPFILSILKKTMNMLYGESGHEFLLPRTWRCPPTVAKAANHLMDTKHRLHRQSEDSLRRPYREVQSAQTDRVEGIVSLFDHSKVEQLREFAASSQTVVIVEQLTEKVRKAINSRLGTNNILTSEDAIGLDFEHVILWNPIQDSSLFKLQSPKLRAPGLTLDQLNTFSALYVALTRAMTNAFIVEEIGRFKPILAELFGDALPINQKSVPIKKLTAEQEKEQWLTQVHHHLKNNRAHLAREIMDFHLHMSAQEIEQFIKQNSEAAVSATPPQPTLHKKTKTKSAKETSPSVQPLDNGPASANTLELAPSTPPQVESTPKSSTKPSSAQEATASLSEDKKAKQLEYIKNLLRSVSQAQGSDEDNFNRAKANIDMLLKHSKAEFYLLQPLLENNSCLLVQLLTLADPKICEHLLNKIQENVFIMLYSAEPQFYLSRISKQHPSLFALLCKTKEGTKILLQYASDRRQTSFFTAELLFKEIDERSQQSALTNLLVNSPEYLFHLATQEPRLLQAMDSQTLYRTPHGSWTSLFMSISMQPQGPNFLAKLYETNPRLLNDLNFDLLLEPYSGPNQALGNQTPLHRILLSECDFLMKLFEIKPDIMAPLREEHLFSQTRNQSGAIISTSMAENIFLNPNRINVQFTKKVFKSLPEFAKRITIPFLRAVYANYPGAKPDRIAILGECLKRACGAELLSFMILINKDLVPQLSGGLLNSNYGSPDNYCSLLTLLCRTVSGIQFLNLLNRLNPQFGKSISLIRVMKPPALTQEQPITNLPLLTLLNTNEGVALLLDFLKISPQLFKEINTDHMRFIIDQLAKSISADPHRNAFQTPDKFALFLDQLKEVNPQIVSQLRKVMDMLSTPPEPVALRLPFFSLHGPQLTIRIREQTGEAAASAEAGLCPHCGGNCSSSPSSSPELLHTRWTS
jgi:hypothetical protein